MLFCFKAKFLQPDGVCSVYMQEEGKVNQFKRKLEKNGAHRTNLTLVVINVMSN